VNWPTTFSTIGIVLVANLTCLEVAASETSDRALNHEFWKLCLTELQGRLDHVEAHATNLGYKPADPIHQMPIDRFTLKDARSKSFESGVLTLETFYLSDETQFATVCRASMHGDLDLSLGATKFVEQLASIARFPHGGEASMHYESTSTWVLYTEPWASISVTRENTESGAITAIAFTQQKPKN
jgi:hypothetical protein